jgi:hypothetical protein
VLAVENADKETVGLTVEEVADWVAALIVELIVELVERAELAEKADLVDSMVVQLN